MGKRMLLGAALLAMVAATPAQAQYWSRSWMAAPLVNRAPLEKHPDLNDRTVRQVVRLSNGGQRIRIRLSNEMSVNPLLVGSVHVALAGENGAIVPGSDHVVTFNQAQGATIPARAPLLSDPIDLAVKPLTRISISIHLPQGAADATVHSYSAATTWTAPGDQTGAQTLTSPAVIGPRVVISAVEVDNAKRGTAIVTLGDSITDGVRATPTATGAGPICWPSGCRKPGARASALPMPGSAPTGC
ncbi:hypothetical protein ACFSUK_19880 [Sphingobium scionense]